MSTNLEINRNPDEIPEHKKKSFKNMSRYLSNNLSQRTIDKSCMVLVEVIGTATLVFFGCAGGIHWIGDPGQLIPPFNFGLVVLFVVQMFGHISFALINPSVVICAVINNFISVKTAILFIIAEIVGSIIGYGLLMYVTPANLLALAPNGLCVTAIHPEVSIPQAFLVEFLITSCLVLVVSGAWDPRNNKNTDSTSLRIGFAVASLCIVAAPITGASMNPARSIGPALWNWNWKNHWVYWVSPLSAAYISSKFYRIVLWRKEAKEITESNI